MLAALILLLVTAISLLLLGAFLIPLVALAVLGLSLILLVLLLALLLIPFHLQAQIARREGRSSMRFGVRGIIGFSRTTEDGETSSALLLFRTARKGREQKKEETEEKREKDRGRKGIPIGDLLELLPELPDLVGAVLRLLNALRRSVAMERLKGEVRVGLGDPGQTGMLVGLTHALGGMVSPWADVSDLTVLPVFDQAVLEGELEMKLRLRLFRLVGPVTRLFLKEPIRKLMMASGGG